MHDVFDWLQWLFAPVFAVLGWVMKRLHARVDYLEQNYVNKQDMRDIRDDLRTEVREGFKEIKQGMERIYDKLDGKADK